MLRARDLSRKEVARLLGVTDSTIQKALWEAYAKLGVDSIVGAMHAMGWVCGEPTT